MDEQVYEYACHEANYGLEGVMSGARAQEREARRSRHSNSDGKHSDEDDWPSPSSACRCARVALPRRRLRRRQRFRQQPKVWSVPRTPDGKPDLQGNWTNETLTPLERPTWHDRSSCRTPRPRGSKRDWPTGASGLPQPSDPNRPAPPQGGDGSTGAAGNVGGYNNFWLAPGERVARIRRRSAQLAHRRSARLAACRR